MKKILGIFGLLAFVCVATGLLSDSFWTPYNIENLIRRTALFGIISVGVAFVIITSGIDLSIGSVVCLVGCGLPWVLTVHELSIPMALLLVVLISLTIGTTHGLLITKLKLQPFVVTLCGLLMYRGITRGFTGDQTQGFKNDFKGLRWLSTGEVPIEQVLPFLGVLAILLAITGWMLWRDAWKPVWKPAVCGGAGVVMVVLGLSMENPTPSINAAAPSGSMTDIEITVPAGLGGVLIEARQNEEGWTRIATVSVKKSDSIDTASSKVRGLWTIDQLRALPQSDFGVPMPCIILALVAVLAAVFLNMTIYGRYLLALGRNEEAAKYSGINTDRMIVLAYIICSGMAGLGGMLFVLDVNSAQPVDFGSFYELYAIAAAVLGGCSLRGGQGTILGVVVGAALILALRNMIVLVDWIPTHIEYAVIGAVILSGVVVDEIVKRMAAKRRTVRKI